MQVVNKTSTEFLYQQVIRFVLELKDNGILRPGDKLPSLRKLGLQLDISVPTVKQAYIELERQGVVTAKPKSGYFLQAQLARTLLPMKSKWSKVDPCNVTCRSLIERVYDAVHLPHTMPLGISNPAQVYPADKALARLMRKVISNVAHKAVSYGPVNGDIKLRTQIALRYQEQGTRINPEEVIITNGAQEALAIALQCVTKQGDVVAVESPTYFGVLELMEALGLKVVEVYTCAKRGLCEDSLQEAIAQHDIKACLFSTAVNNPLGSYMDDNQRKAIVSLLEQHNIPLIEDDVYSELYFTDKKPKPYSHFSQNNTVMTCSSFSKTVAPGYRIGWLFAGKWQEKAKQYKRGLSSSTSPLQQWTLCEYMLTGDYDRQLVKLRKQLSCQAERMRALVAQHFPESTCISQPQGGAVLWIRCRSQVHTELFFDQAVQEGVSFSPGKIFSPSGKYHNYMRISYGIRWNDDVESAIATLGALVAAAQRDLPSYK